MIRGQSGKFAFPDRPHGSQPVDFYYTLKMYYSTVFYTGRGHSITDWFVDTKRFSNNANAAVGGGGDVIVFYFRRARRPSDPSDTVSIGSDPSVNNN